ncbi:MAG: ATP-binding protein [Chitinophagaceae bacterium]|nr:ATP-binding protein [Chitinophagaceae bacterium]
MSTTAATIPAINRFPGVKPFTSTDQHLFFGREADLSALNSLIFIKQSVVLYGKSGYGKSSLINAGIIPRLQEKEAWQYFTIRFKNYSEKGDHKNLHPVETIRQRLREQFSGQEENEFGNLIPAENSSWYWIKQHQWQHQKAKFILFFDQFEELFTYPKEEVNEFSEELSRLLYNTIPTAYRRKLAELDEKGIMTDDLHDFCYDKPEIKVVYSVRSDRLSLLNALTDRHPSILQNCYELDALSRQDAEEAIRKPAKLPQGEIFASPPFEFTNEAITKILDHTANPADGKVEASTLQIVCRYVEDTLAAGQKHRLITDNLLGDIKDIFLQYYENTLGKLDMADRDKVQRLIEDELIDGDRRNPLTEGYIQRKFGFSEALLRKLEDSSLLRKERDAAGRWFYEVSHDSLVTAINKVAENRRRIEEERQKQALEKQVAAEKQRAEELLVLNTKARNRTRIAVAFALICILIMALTIIFGLRARRMEQLARQKEELARHSQLQAEKASASLLVEKGDSYFAKEDTSQIKDPEIRKGFFFEAKLMYDSAFRLVQNKTNDSLYLLILNRVKLCEQNLK